MLVDDSNEDWWKVLWQGGVQGEEGSDSCCSIFPFRLPPVACPGQAQGQPLGLAVSFPPHLSSDPTHPIAFQGQKPCSARSWNESPRSGGP